VSLKFHAPAHGLHQLQVMCVSDYWIGCDARFQLKLKARGCPSCKLLEDGV
jgi:hypothetical protein